MTNAAATLNGHQKSVTGLVWHKIAMNLLATMGMDGTARIWDVENQKPLIVFPEIKE